MKILKQSRTERENSLDFIDYSGKHRGVYCYRYRLIFAGWKYEIVITKEKAGRIRDALKENNSYVIYQMLIPAWN